MRTCIEQLPNGIIIPGGGAIREVELRKLDGNDEDMLLDKQMLREGGILDRLLKRVIVRIGDHTDSKEIGLVYDSGMLMADLTFLLVKTRMWGIHQNYRFELACPRCEKVDMHKIDLSTLKIDEQKDEFRGHLEYLDVVEGEPVRFRNLMASDTKMQESIKSSYPREKGTRELLLQLKEIGGKPVDAIAVKALSMGFRNALRIAMDAKNGGINTELILNCTKCDRTFKETMPVDVRSFFFPTGDTSETQTARPFLTSGPISPSLDLASAGLPPTSEPSASKSEFTTST